ncbi:DUF1127 domain-containing protein, partial [Microvirga sp. BT689]|uniref:DUF1127 domain-containing protein n=1 Tax=Microvirga arvi TaxID=2778731 RepID=UPI001950B572
PAPRSRLYRSNLPMWMSLILAKVQAWITYRDTVRELQYVGDKELLDLGISRSDIKDVARRVTQEQSAPLT